MPFDLPILSRASAMMTHAQTRQTLVAQNIAHADTPGYRARDLPDFARLYEQGMFEARASRAGHAGVEGALLERAREISGAGLESPDGNTVTLEDQMLRGVEAQRAHSRAVTVYDKSLDILRLAMGRGR